MRIDYQRESKMENNNSAPNVTTVNVRQTQVQNDNKCPSCGATLAYDPLTGNLVCNFCGTSVRFDSAYAEPELGYTLTELQNIAGKNIWQTTSKLITCGSCGGQFVADPSSISGLCPFCGSNSVTQSDVNGTPEPTGVVPFAIDKASAQVMLKQWLSQCRNVAADVAQNTQFSDLEGVYVPYWIFSCDTTASYKGQFGINRGCGEDSYVEWHKSSGVTSHPFKDLTVIASNRLANDYYWKDISSFNFDYAQKFNPNLLAGFWAESYSIDGAQAWQTAMNKIYETIKEDIKAREIADHVDKLEMNPSASNVHAKYVLAPIWITSFKYKNKIYRTLINGQTGKISGDWPRRFPKALLIVLIIVLAYIGLMLTGGLLSCVVAALGA